MLTLKLKKWFYLQCNLCENKTKNTVIETNSRQFFPIKCVKEVKGRVNSSQERGKVGAITKLLEKKKMN